MGTGLWYSETCHEWNGEVGGSNNWYSTAVSILGVLHLWGAAWMCAVIFLDLYFCVFCLWPCRCGSCGNASLGGFHQKAQGQCSLLMLSLYRRIAGCGGLIWYESCKNSPCFHCFGSNYLHILIWCFSEMSHVNRHNKNKINASSVVHIMICRLFMLSHVLLIVFLQKYYKITPYMIFHSCPLCQLIVSSQSKEIYWIVCL